MKLFVCHGTFKHAPRPGGHPCGQAHAALAQAGHQPEVVKTGGLGILPAMFNRSAGRREVKRLTGSFMVPVLVLDDGEVIRDSKRIIEWANAHPVASV